MTKTVGGSAYSSTSAWVTAGLMIVSALLIKRLELGGMPRFAAALLPLPTLVWMFVVLARWIQKLDELQQRIRLVAMAIAFAGTALTVLIYGSLQIGGFPEANWGFVWPVMVVLYYVGLFFARRRYQ